MTGPGGPDGTDDVTVGAVTDNLQVTAAQFRTGSLAWRVRDTATGSPPDEITVRFDNEKVGVTPVDPEGGWDVRRTALFRRLDSIGQSLLSGACMMRKILVRR